jgi:hypothetical protein
MTHVLSVLIFTSLFLFRMRIHVCVRSLVYCRVTLQHTEQMADGRWQMADGCDLYFNTITHYVITQCSVRPFILFWMLYKIHITLPHTLRESENESVSTTLPELRVHAAYHVVTTLRCSL